MVSVEAVFRRILPPALAGACLLYFYSFAATTGPEPLASIRCVFEAEPEQAPIKLGSYTAPLSELTVTGDLSDPFENVSFDFEGSAEYLIEAKRIKADARRSIFVFEPLPQSPSATVSADAVALTIEDDGFGRGGLSVFTLDENGKLNEASDTVYAWTNKDFRLSHPMTTDCVVSPA